MVMEMRGDGYALCVRGGVAVSAGSFSCSLGGERHLWEVAQAAFCCSDVCALSQRSFRDRRDRAWGHRSSGCRPVWTCGWTQARPLTGRWFLEGELRLLRAGASEEAGGAYRDGGPDVPSCFGCLTG